MAEDEDEDDVDDHPGQVHLPVATSPQMVAGKSANKTCTLYTVHCTLYSTTFLRILLPPFLLYYKSLVSNKILVQADAINGKTIYEHFFRILLHI